jgi:uncharacterized membrane-anchored protein
VNLLSSERARLTAPGALRVPEITAWFWIIKGLSTAMGESTSDYLVHAMAPVLAVLLGFAGFVAALVLQFAMCRYTAVAYWLAVVMVGVFGTMAADVLHVGFGVPYVVSSVLYAVALAAVTLHLGYLGAAVLFAGLILVPAGGYRWGGWNPVLSFWLAYVLTRPLGASVADWLGKPRALTGLGLGDGPVTVVLLLLIAAFVGYLAVTRRDVQRPVPAVATRGA